MYRPASFVETDRIRLFSLIETYSFGTLVVADGSGAAEISHLPFVLDRDAVPHGRLLVHVARANPIWKAALDQQRAVAIFAGPHAYVSPRWYATPTTSVPTWNYAVAHVHGRVDGPLARAELGSVLERLVEAHERGARPWRMAELDAALRDNLLKAIVGFSIAIERIDGKFKLSQNRPAEDRQRVVDALAVRGNPDDLALARLMSGNDPRRAGGES